MYTEWFSPTQPPARTGVYVLKRAPDAECWHLGFWNGVGWYAAESVWTGHCSDMDLIGGSWSHNNYWWRGLTQKARKALDFVSP